MATTYILDGYNLIRSILRGGKERATGEVQRFTLEHELRRFRAAAGPGTKIYLVYDGEQGLPASARREKGFEVLFSKPPEQADDVVLALARRLEGPADVCVVTTDLADIARRLQGLRVRHLTSREFAALVSRKLGSDAAAEPPPEKPATLVPSEVDDWLRRFGFAPEPEEGEKGRP